MDCNHMSVSRKSVWDQCHQKYKYQYHLRIKPDIPEPPYFLYGSVVHKICEEYVTYGGRKSIGELAQDVLDGIIPLDRKGEESKKIELDPDYKKKLPEHLFQFKRLNERIEASYPGPKQDITEWEFHHDLKPPHKFMVTGFIDRLIKIGDNYFIIDYKTTKKSKWRKDLHTITSDLQLRTYARIVQKQHGAKPENIIAGLFYFDGGELVCGRFSEKSLIAAENELLRAYEEILAMHPDEVLGSLGHWCKRCEYVQMCPFYSIT